MLRGVAFRQGTHYQRAFNRLEELIAVFFSYLAILPLLLLLASHLAGLLEPLAPRESYFSCIPTSKLIHYALISTIPTVISLISTLISSKVFRTLSQRLYLVTTRALGAVAATAASNIIGGGSGGGSGGGDKSALVKKEAAIFAFPNHILQHIFTFFPAAELATIEAVSKRFLGICTSSQNILWDPLFAKMRNIRYPGRNAKEVRSSKERVKEIFIHNKNKRYGQLYLADIRDLFGDALFATTILTSLCFLAIAFPKTSLYLVSAFGADVVFVILASIFGWFVEYRYYPHALSTGIVIVVTLYFRNFPNLILTAIRCYAIFVLFANSLFTFLFGLEQFLFCILITLLSSIAELLCHAINFLPALSSMWEYAAVLHLIAFRFVWPFFAIDLLRYYFGRQPLLWIPPMRLLGGRGKAFYFSIGIMLFVVAAWQFPQGDILLRHSTFLQLTFVAMVLQFIFIAFSESRISRVALLWAAAIFIVNRNVFVGLPVLFDQIAQVWNSLNLTSMFPAFSLVVFLSFNAGASFSTIALALVNIGSCSLKANFLNFLSPGSLFVYAILDFPSPLKYSSGLP